MFAAQGGAPEGCAVPVGSSAVEVSLSAVAPRGNGFLRTWPAGTGFPNATVLNISPGQGATNTGPLTLAPGTDLTVATQGATAHHVLDVQGYWQVPAITRLPSDADLSYAPSISDDGRFVVFNGRPSDFQVPPRQVLLWDRETGTTRPIADGGSFDPDPEISGDGRYVTFQSDDPTLVPGTANPRINVFLWDRTTGATTQITDGDGSSTFPSIDRDGSTVAFSSAATDLVNTETVIYIKQGVNGTSHPAISDDGRSVVFYAYADQGVFLWRRATGEAAKLSGIPGGRTPDISSDGQFVTYESAYETSAGQRTAVYLVDTERT